MLKDGVSTLEKRAPVVTLVPNPNYWNKGRMPKATMQFDNVISKSEALDEVMKGGKVDIVTELTPAEAAQVRKSKNAHVVKSKAKTVLVGVFNQESSSSKWNDARLRKAINLAVDRRTVVKDGMGGYGTVIGSMIIPGQFASTPSMKPYGYNPAAAKQALSRAGVSSITIVSDDGHRGVADVIAKSMEKAGVSVNIVGEAKGDWDIMLVEHFDWSPNFPVGVVYREFFGEDGGFRKGPVDPKLGALIAKTYATSSLAKQEQLTREIDSYVHTNAQVLFLPSPSKLYAVSNKVNFVPYKTTVLELAETTIKK